MSRLAQAGPIGWLALTILIAFISVGVAVLLFAAFAITTVIVDHWRDEQNRPYQPDLRDLGLEPDRAGRSPELGDVDRATALVEPALEPPVTRDPSPADISFLTRSRAEVDAPGLSIGLSL